MQKHTAHRKKGGMHHPHEKKKSVSKMTATVSAKRSVKRFSKRFCPQCGNTFEGRGTLCSHCRKADFAFKDITFTICTSCKSYLHHNKWTTFSDINKAVAIVAKQGIKAKVKVQGYSEQDTGQILAFKAGVDREYPIAVDHHREIFDIPTTVKITLCPKCAKKGTKYFEGVLQLRNADEEIYQFVRNDIEKQKKRGIYINKESRIDKYDSSNVDFYITNQTYIKTLAEKIRRQYGAIIKKNAQLFSIDWETSKNLYRTNIYVEVPKYKKGDVIKHDGNLLLIMSISGKIHATNIKTRKKTALTLKDTYDVLKPQTMMIIKLYPEAEVLDPDTYYQARLANPGKKLEINQQVKAVVDGSEAWMV